MKQMSRIAIAALFAMLAAGTCAHQYPARPITMLCWSAAGSPVDIYARVMAKLLSAELGQNVLVAFARKKPNFINIGGPFTISGHRVAWEVFAEAATFKTSWVPYQGGGPALTAVAGGHIDAAATNPGNVKPFIEAGKVRVLAISSDRRLEDFPDVPTYKERGWDVVRYQWRGIMARAGTPKPVIDRLASTIQKAQQTTEWKNYLRQVVQLDGFQGPDAFRAQLVQDMQEMEAVKKKLGL
ncbi:MAG: tripartite tricarboxylate transporter substrate binding protein [Betaproteobacteria bacterium]|nr:tripartite tricarboxylate transporter substrate binding protein [Betaproteobacteria bacterium]MBI2290571.1 tripartite tricarboxylate transporter substrate binding protein [Betaproteobacteria bacterium]MBI3053125.1 tripartite tricarboxylate transporter substrate binding protein [Betaproteobacteria bacterium]